MTSATARPTLPVWATVSQAFASVLANWLAVLRIFWAWAVILCVLYAGQLLIPLSMAVPSFATFVLPKLLSAAVVMIAIASTAVAWHRLMILGERPPAVYLRVGGQVPRYIGRLLLIALAALPIQLVCSLFLFPLLAGLALPSPNWPPSAGRMLALTVIGLVISLPAFVVTIRLSISLPGIAVGRTMTLEDAWQLTKGNTLQLCGGTLFVYVPSYAFGIAVIPLWEAQSSSLWALWLISVNILSTVAAISFLSLSYRFFAGALQPAQPQPS